MSLNSNLAHQTLFPTVFSHHRPIEVDGEPEFEITEILDSKIDKCRKHCQLLYLVCWAGYEGTDKETSWLLATELGNASELVKDFHTVYSDKPGPLRAL
jgi:hypothetical protein